MKKRENTPCALLRKAVRLIREHKKRRHNAYPGADGSYYDYAAQGGARTGRFGCSACGFNQKR